MYSLNIRRKESVKVLTTIETQLVVATGAKWIAHPEDYKTIAFIPMAHIEYIMLLEPTK
jgi:hypothetical protein